MSTLTRMRQRALDLGMEPVAWRLPDWASELVDLVGISQRPVTLYSEVITLTLFGLPIKAVEKGDTFHLEVKGKPVTRVYP